MVTKEKIFNFLDGLRNSGSVNMFGASLKICEEFSIDKRQSGKLLVEWMETYDKRHPLNCHKSGNDL